MMKRSAIVLLVGFFMLTLNIAPQTVALPTDIQSGTTYSWHVNVAPHSITNMFYSGGGNMLADNGSSMHAEVETIGEDIIGTYSIGNVTVRANDTEIARDLVLGVWGTYTEWWPGLFIETGQSNIDSLNESAYAAAERVYGNYLNGTMTSRYDNVSVFIWNFTAAAYDLENEECIVFDFEQDPTGFGEPQITHLAYSLTSGVLMRANTSYSFGDPYYLSMTYMEPGDPTPVDMSVDFGNLIIISGIIGGGFLAVIVISYIWLSRRN
jgi:hypothetical protein